jgi:hypothetical protein
MRQVNPRAYQHNDDDNNHQGSRKKKTRIMSEEDRFWYFFERLQPLARTQINHVQLFVSHDFLASFQDPHFREEILNKHFRASTLTLTIRQRDYRAGATKDYLKMEWSKALLDSELFQRNVGAVVLQLEMYVDEEGLGTARSTPHEFQTFVPDERFGVKREEWIRPADPWMEEGKKKYLVLSGRQINQGNMEKVLETYMAGEQRMEAKKRRRGGKRNKDVWKRRNWQKLTEKEKYWTFKELHRDEKRKLMYGRDEKAAELNRAWEQQGSLLRVI